MAESARDVKNPSPATTGHDENTPLAERYWQIVCRKMTGDRPGCVMRRLEKEKAPPVWAGL